MYEITPERPSDGAAIEMLLDSAFGPGREAKTGSRLRQGHAPAAGLSFVVRDGDGLAASIRFWAIEILDTAPVPALLLGPLAVAPALRGLGLGRALVRHGLAVAERQGHGAVVLVGDADYYGAFGFERRLAAGLTLPGPVDLDRFLALELREGALVDVAGAVVRPRRCLRGVEGIAGISGPRAARPASARPAPGPAPGWPATAAPARRP